MMNAGLPQVISDYIRASNAHDTEAYLYTFTDHSVIVEQSIGRDLVGLDEIRNYFATYFVAYDTHTEVIDFTVNDCIIDMRVLFTGSFPGNKIVGTYQFILKDGHIEQLKAVLE